MHAWVLGLLVLSVTCWHRGSSLTCYECTDSFKRLWLPMTCQVNATANPVRMCTDEQKFCFVERVTVKGIVTRITRNCMENCYYGCKATTFGITSLTCTTCCTEDNCNIGNTASAQTHRPQFSLVAYAYVVPEAWLATLVSVWRVWVAGNQ